MAAGLIPVSVLNSVPCVKFFNKSRDTHVVWVCASPALAEDAARILRKQKHIEAVELFDAHAVTAMSQLEECERSYTGKV